jgi:prepilin-type N-terminal cleavage/methylation domain-containing protein/prepilin-type processing-associated H-X9-DG protein
MNVRSLKPEGSAWCVGVDAFTLIELMVVVGVIAILTALLLPVLSKARAQSQATACRNHLHQIGLAMTMYVAEHNRYPPMHDWNPGPSFLDLWADKLYPYAPLDWTNTSWHCPTYIARGGFIECKRAGYVGTSYAYNAHGGGYHGSLDDLGLDTKFGRTGIREQQVQAPSQMYTVADARAYQAKPLLPGETALLQGMPLMSPWNGNFMPGIKDNEVAPPHAQGYDILFADGHVSLVKRRDYLYPPRTAHNWNRDNQPHPEFWLPKNRWPVQN